MSFLLQLLYVEILCFLGILQLGGVCLLQLLKLTWLGEPAIRFFGIFMFFLRLFYEFILKQLRGVAKL